MTLKADFNLYDCFGIFDPCKRGLVGVHEIRAGLSAIGVFPTSEEIELFMTRYDLNGDRLLCFNEMSKAFESLDGYYAHMLNRRASN